jgi:hypothetical protein
VGNTTWWVVMVHPKILIKIEIIVLSFLYKEQEALYTDKIQILQLT